MRPSASAALVTLVVIAGCARTPSPHATSPITARSASRDTLFGRVYDTRDARAALPERASREPRIMGLQQRDGSQFVLGGAESVPMGALAGVGAVVEIWVSGARDSSTFFVDEFEVRRVGGQEVDDGHVLVVGSRVLLVTRDGARREIADPPPPLRYLVGSRVWIVRATPRTTPTPFGIIVRK